MIILFLWADIIKRIHMGSLFFKIWHIVYEKITKKEVKKMINSFIYSFIYLIRFLCEIIITLAAVKYLMPEIRKICRMIAGSEEKAQQKEAPGLVRDFLQQAGYPPDYLPRVLELVVNHHCYTGPHSQLLQLLIEADLIVNAYEEPLSEEERVYVRSLFHSDAGKELFLLQDQRKT